MKLVLFDIDGTLIRHIGTTTKDEAVSRFSYAIKKVYGVTLPPIKEWIFNGVVDRAIVKTLLSGHGISDEVFSKQFSFLGEIMKDYVIRNTSSSYTPIKEAVQLATMLAHDSRYRLGLLTGNLERMGWWKLEHAGIADLFNFGLFGDDVDDRVTLAKTVFEKAKKHFNIIFEPKDIVIIGDTYHDIRCGKAIKATTLAVASGGHDISFDMYWDTLEKEHPDILVKSLMDKSVLDYFGIKKV